MGATCPPSFYFISIPFTKTHNIYYTHTEKTNYHQAIDPPSPIHSNAQYWNHIVSLNLHRKHTHTHNGNILLSTSWWFSSTHTRVALSKASPWCEWARSAHFQRVSSSHLASFKESSPRQSLLQSSWWTYSFIPDPWVVPVELIINTSLAHCWNQISSWSSTSTMLTNDPVSFDQLRLVVIPNHSTFCKQANKYVHHERRNMRR